MENLNSMANRKQKNNFVKPTFPEETGLIIEKILEKYGLKEQQEEGVRKFFDSQIPTKRKEIFENLPGFKISKLLKECAEGEVSLIDLSRELEQRLNIALKEAKQMEDDLQKTILNFIKLEALTEERVTPTRVTELIEEGPSLRETRRPSSKDDYREQIE